MELRNIFNSLPRAVLIASLLAAPLVASTDAAVHRAVAPAGVGGAGRGTLLATDTLVNETGRMLPVGSITPIFGIAFVKGDIPTGTAPKLKISDADQPYSWGLQSYWSDGSLRTASFMLRTTTAISTGTIPLEVWSNGTPPAASPRTLAEVYAQNITVNTTSPLGKLSAWLTNDSNNVEQFTYLDGGAGRIWRILTHTAATQGGSQDGQVEAYHYIAALTDSNGTGLKAFRYLPRLTQPWYNKDTPAKNYRVFTAVNWQLGLGAATAFSFGPSAGTSFNTRNFTASVGSTDFTATSTHNWWIRAIQPSGSALPPTILANIVMSYRPPPAPERIRSYRSMRSRLSAICSGRPPTRNGIFSFPARPRPRPITGSASRSTRTTCARPSCFRRLTRPLR
jgi:hypothetical protein